MQKSRHRSTLGQEPEAHERCHHKKQFQNQQDARTIHRSWQSQSSGSRIVHRTPSAKGAKTPKQDLEKMLPKKMGERTHHTLPRGGKITPKAIGYKIRTVVFSRGVCL